MYFIACDRADLMDLTENERDDQRMATAPGPLAQDKPMALPDGVTSDAVAAFLHSLNKRPRLD